MIIAEIGIIPLETEDTSAAIDVAIAAIQRSGLEYEVGALGTTIEGERDAVFQGPARRP